MNVKAGDLAIIVSERNHGALVHVLGPYPDEPMAWWVNPMQPCVDNFGLHHPAGIVGWCPDNNLRPLRGDPVSQIRDVELADER